MGKSCPKNHSNPVTTLEKKSEFFRLKIPKRLLDLRDSMPCVVPGLVHGAVPSAVSGVVPSLFASGPEYRLKVRLSGLSNLFEYV